MCQFEINKKSSLAIMVKKLFTFTSTHSGLKLTQVMFWQTFIALKHLFMFKYHVDQDKYVKILIPIHQKESI